VRIAVIGDVHLVWDERDVRQLEAAGYDLVLFVGDLAGYGADGALRVARSIATLRTPALVMPGNHDAVTVPQLAAEVFRAPDALRSALALGMPARVQALARALGPVPLCGYSLHPFQRHGVTVLAARPHSLGGPRLGFRRYLAHRFGVRSFADSAARLCALIDAIPDGQRVIVLAHAGPSGLGATREAIYGCDFRPEQGDWGDTDLAEALAHARAAGKQVVAVVAGHMHHRLRGGGERQWHLTRDGIEHVNAARVPRARRTASGSERHHVRLSLAPDGVRVDPVWMPV
jgi:uncharacterized protein (TIGR04168 family)